jgi:chromosome segregation ATPase
MLPSKTFAVIGQAPTPPAPQGAINIGWPEIVGIGIALSYAGRELWKEYQKNATAQNTLTNSVLKTLFDNAAEDRKAQIETVRHQAETQQASVNRLNDSLERLSEHMVMLSDQTRESMAASHKLAEEVATTLSAVQAINKRVWETLQKDSRDTTAIFVAVQRALASMEESIHRVGVSIEALHARFDKHKCPPSHPVADEKAATQL